MPLQTPIDYLVAVTLLCVIGGLAFAFVRARRPELWRRLWLAWGLLFVVVEVVGAFHANTLSENLIASLPLPLLISGTIALALILCVHWWDLARRKIHGRNSTRLRRVTSIKQKEYPMENLPFVLQQLLQSRRFWLSVLAVIVTGLGVAFPGISPAFVNAFTQFAIILIAAFTLDDTVESIAAAFYAKKK